MRYTNEEISKAFTGLTSGDVIGLGNEELLVVSTAFDFHGAPPKDLGIVRLMEGFGTPNARLLEYWMVLADEEKDGIPKLRQLKQIPPVIEYGENWKPILDFEIWKGLVGGVVPQ